MESNASATRTWCSTPNPLSPDPRTLLRPCLRWGVAWSRAPSNCCSPQVSRLPTTSSQLFGNNVAKFLLSVGPQTTGVKGEYLIDYEDEV